MLFTLRKVDQQELIAGAGSSLAKMSKAPATAKVLADDNLAELFGIDIGPINPPTPVAGSPVAAKPSKPRSAKRKPTRAKRVTVSARTKSTGPREGRSNRKRPRR
jgi:hypothetical protein